MHAWCRVLVDCPGHLHKICSLTQLFLAQHQNACAQKSKWIFFLQKFVAAKKHFFLHEHSYALFRGPPDLIASTSRGCGLVGFFRAVNIDKQRKITKHLFLGAIFFGVLFFCADILKRLFSFVQMKRAAESTVDQPGRPGLKRTKYPCGNRPSFNVPGPANGGWWCAKCPDRDPEAVNLRSTQCVISGCSICATFGFARDNKRRWCSAHAKEQKNVDEPIVCVTKARCTCGKVAIFKTNGTKRATHCGRCKTSDMMDVRNTRCNNCPSGLRALYTREAQPGKKWCSKCKPKDAIQRHRKCKIAGCNRTSSYGSKGDPTRRRRWCKEHAKQQKDATAIQTKSKARSPRKCKCTSGFPPAYRCPSRPGETFCRKCKPEGAKHRGLTCNKCRKTIANFAESVNSKPTWCKGCAPQNAVNVRKGHCQGEPGCTIAPNYAFQGEKAARWCAKCAKIYGEGKAVDVTGKMCEHCRTVHATLGIESKPRWCAECARLVAPSAFDVKSLMCIHAGCKTHASFNVPGITRPVYCRQHAPGNAENVAPARRTLC